LRLFFKTVDDRVLLFKDLFLVDAVGNLADNCLILFPNDINFLTGKLGLDGFVGKVLIVASVWFSEIFFVA
jgi:hypothetical protein